MPVEPQPAELARLIDFAERPREGEWSLRSALVRYAQPRAEQVSGLLDLVRRIDFALSPNSKVPKSKVPNSKVVERTGPALSGALQSDDAPRPEPEATVVGLLRACTELDQLADLLAAWASDPSCGRPDIQVDTTLAAVERQLDDLGVAREERQRSPTRRG